MILGNHLLGGDTELIEHAVWRAEGAENELRAAALDVLLDAGGQDLDGAEGRAGAHGRLVHAIALDVRLGDGAGVGFARRHREVDESDEVVLGHLPLLRGRELPDLLDAHAELLGRDEGGDPAVAQAPRALLGRLALAADPDGRRILPRLGEYRHSVELEELTLVGHLVLCPEEAEDLDGLVRAPATLLEGHAGGVELARELDAHPDGGKEPPA